MIFLAKTNNAVSTLLGSILATDLVISVQAGDQNRFPQRFPFVITVWYANNDISSGEIMLATGYVGGMSSNSFQVVRGQENTMAQAFAPSTNPVQVQLEITAGQLIEHETYMNGHTHNGSGNGATLASNSVGSNQIQSGALQPNHFSVNSVPVTALINGGGFIPIGGIIDYWSDGQALPASFMVADGSIVNNTNSPLNGLTLPNLINQFVRGVANQALRQKGILGGEDTHTLSGAELPTHSHGVNDPGHGHGVSDPGHAHSFTRQMEVISNQNFYGTGFNPIINDGNSIQTNPSGTGVSVNVAGSNVSVQNSGLSAPHNNIPSYVGLVKIIRIV